MNKDIKSVLARTSKVYNLRNLKRFSSSTIIQSESVLEHSGYVAHAVLDFNKTFVFDLSKAVKMALFHDIAETELGDIISKPKRKYKYFKEAVEKVEKNIISDNFPDLVPLLHEYTRQTSLESELVKLADLLSVVMFISKEVELGNTLVKDILEDTSKLYSKKLDSIFSKMNTFCPTCRRIYHIKPSHLRLSGNCCCLKCRDEYVKENKIGWLSDESKKKIAKTKEKNHDKNYIISTINCKNCNNEIKLEHKIDEQIDRNFCNSNCFGEYNINMQKQKCIGWFDKEKSRLRRIKATKTNKKNQTGIFSVESRKKALKNSMKAQLEKRNNRYKGLFFGSKGELATAKFLEKNISDFRLLLGKTFQINVGSRYFDFLVKKTFIEFHPGTNWCHDIKGKEYYDFRRKILDDNGYDDFKLVVLEKIPKTKEELEEFRR